MKKRKIFLMIFTVLSAALLVSACASTAATPNPTGTSEATQPPATETPNPAAAFVDSALQALASQLGIQAPDVKVLSVTPAEWPNGCLGAPKPDEVCTQVITPGYSVVLEANGVQYEVRTDQTAGQVRIVPEALSAVESALATKLGLSSDAIRLLSIEHVTWNNACLGVESPNVMCAEVVTPGYSIVLDANGKTYVYHTDESGKSLALAEIPLPETGGASIVWQQNTDQGCRVVMIKSTEVTFGACDATLTTIPFPMDINSTDLMGFVNKFAPFEVDTAGGTLKFMGKGTQVATAAEQRMIAESAKLVQNIVETGSFDPAWGRAFTWHREGGIAGFCDDLSVYLNGVAAYSSCKPGKGASPRPILLSSDQLTQLYAWVDSLKSFDFQQSDAATADAMKITMHFEGLGTQEASPDVQQAIQLFATQVFTQATSGSPTK